ncbi:hypothetical protein CPB83DRAFT_118206 [Crepidotus variabilis]|uniref:Uncharacterized protein n=1 Tax=Crepidotus variabilis TaxID=179855 RepID=A0A9P6E4F1_9AGAR|nr:hypothetical protein CPB83DRAFT_118206 [Crepidotus variabilis]
MGLLDHYHQSALEGYFADDCLTDLLTFVTYPDSLWDWIHVWPLLGLMHSETVEREESDRKKLHLLGLKQTYDSYRHILAQYLADETRAGRYHLVEAHYTRVALKVAKYLFEPKQPGKLYLYNLPQEWTWYREGHEDKIFREKKTKETFQAGIQYLPYLLQQSGPNEDLVSYLEQSKLDPIRAQELPRVAWAEDKTKLEAEVAAYLKKYATRANSTRGESNGTNLITPTNGRHKDSPS